MSSEELIINMSRSVSLIELKTFGNVVSRSAIWMLLVSSPWFFLISADEVPTQFTLLDEIPQLQPRIEGSVAAEGRITCFDNPTHRF